MTLITFLNQYTLEIVDLAMVCTPARGASIYCFKKLFITCEYVGVITKLTVKWSRHCYNGIIINGKTTANRFGPLHGRTHAGS